MKKQGTGNREQGTGAAEQLAVDTVKPKVGKKKAAETPAEKPVEVAAAYKE